MRVAVVGRSEILLAAAKHLQSCGHSIGLVVTAKGAPEYVAQAADFEAFATSIGAEFMQTAKLDVREDFRPLELDVAVSYNFPNVIPNGFFSYFRHGVLNAHGGDLPRYRGNACQAWALLNGEERIGLCVHRMAEALDAGDIISRDYLPVSTDTKITAVHDWMLRTVPRLFEDALARLQADPSFVLERQSTDPTAALRCYPRRPEDGRIDWKRSALEVIRLINASNKPYRGAYCQLEATTVTVWDAEMVDDGEVFLAVPGQVTAIRDDVVEVACGSGKVRIKQVEVDGVVGPPSAVVNSIRRRFL